MTSNELRAILLKIYNHVENKDGKIYTVNITGGSPEAYVVIDWEAFVSNFKTTNADVQGNVWTKTVANIEYSAKYSGYSTQTVPTSSI